MIEFATLLIGLAFGPHQVEMVVQGPVAAIEISLDGQLVQRLENKPWKVEVDFGSHLTPHRLTASALDRDGKVLDSTHQIINYSRSSFEVAIVLDPAGDGPARTGRVIWQGVLDAAPRSATLRFDHQELPVDPDGGFVLPELDPDALHVLQASVTSAEGSTRLASLTFGGHYVDQTTTTLTAVPVTSNLDQPWSKDQAQNWLQRDGKPLEVFTVTAPTGLAFVVREDRLERAIRSVLPWRDNLRRFGSESDGNWSHDVMAICARPFEGSPGSFRMSHPAGVNSRYDLRQILLHMGPLVPDDPLDGRRLVANGQKLWDALAVAGLNAARKNIPRVVILMISHNLVRDSSQLTPDQAIDYLESIHVPLLIWAPDEDDPEKYGLPKDGRVYLGPAGLSEMEEEVGRELNSQTMIWVEGEHLPTEISLSKTTPPTVQLVH